MGPRGSRLAPTRAIRVSAIGASSPTRTPSTRDRAGAPRRAGGWVFGRYLVLQTPGWALAALGAGALVRWFEVDPRIAGALFALWVIKDFVLYPFLRVAYASGDPDPAAALVGERAIAQETLAPDGYVRIGAELWRAELPSGAQPVARGASVRVRAVRGLTLLVEADPPGATGPGG